MRLLVFDNYDSFTYNLVHLAREIGGASIDVFRNDKIALDAIAVYDKILLSPGPGIPKEAGILAQLVDRYAPSKSILGVCLGHQCIAEQFGGTLHNMPTVVHGKPADITVIEEDSKLFQGMGSEFVAGRYHSWLVERESLPECLAVTAESETGEIMALRHKEFDVQGIQFHPESVLTPKGKILLENWLRA